MDLNYENKKKHATMSHKKGVDNVEKYVAGKSTNRDVIANKLSYWKKKKNRVYVSMGKNNY